MNNKKLRWLALPYLTWMVLFTIIPLALIVVFAFTTRDGAFTFDNIQHAAKYLPVLVKSVWLAALATAISLVIARFCHIGVGRQSSSDTERRSPIFHRAIYRPVRQILVKYYRVRIVC